jgi:hypothetical protein
VISDVFAGLIAAIMPFRFAVSRHTHWGDEAPPEESLLAMLLARTCNIFWHRLIRKTKDTGIETLETGHDCPSHVFVTGFCLVDTVGGN